jgi:DNA-directed RNA polymerase specialized sigma24 family protein
VIQTDQTGVRFATTEWSLIAAVQGDAGEAAREDALRVLVERYWPAVYAALRRWGHARDAAADLTQGFFADVVLPRRLFERADEGRGRLRSLVLTALKRYVVDRHRSLSVRQPRTVIPLDSFAAVEASLEDRSDLQIDDVFARQWALATLQAALDRCEEHYVQSGKADHWRLFRTRVVTPILSGTRAPRLAEVADQHGFASAPAAAAAIQVVRKRLLALLRESVVETLASDEDADEELALMMACLRRL